MSDLRRAFPVFGQRRSGELLEHQARELQCRTAWPMVHHDALRLSGIVEGDQDDDIGRRTTDITGVVLEKAMLTARSGVVELLVVVELPRRCQDGAHIVGTMGRTVHRGGLQGDVGGQVIQPHRIVRRSHVRHAAPPVGVGVAGESRRCEYAPTVRCLRRISTTQPSGSIPTGTEVIAARSAPFADSPATVVPYYPYPGAHPGLSISLWAASTRRVRRSAA